MARPWTTGPWPRRGSSPTWAEPMARPRVGAITLAVAYVAVACGGAAPTSVCGPVEQVTEPGGIHVLPGTEVTYELSPPTSGPHLVPGPDAGRYDEPIPEPRQVSALEAGLVVVQYSDALPAPEVGELRSLSDPALVVAPAARALDDDARVAHTAWGIRQLCQAFDPEAAKAFIDEHGGAGAPTHEG